MSWVSPQNDDDDDDDGFGRPRPFETSDGESLDGSFEQAHLTAGFEPPAAALSATEAPDPALAATAIAATAAVESPAAEGAASTESVSTSGGQAAVKPFILPAVVQCPVIAIIQGARGAVLGFGFGAITGVWQGYQFGARGVPLLQAATVTACRSAGSFGGFLGVFSGVRCGAAAARGRNDLLNVGIAGAAAGATGTLRSRNPSIIAGSAAVGGALMMFTESMH